MVLQLPAYGEANRDRVRISPLVERRIGRTHIDILRIHSAHELKVVAVWFET